MAKIWNIPAFFIALVLALALTYLFWTPVNGMINAMDGIFKPIASFIWVVMLIFGNIIGPIYVLTDERFAVPGQS